MNNEIHHQAKDLLERVKRQIDKHDGEADHLINHVHEFVELVEMQKSPQYLREKIKEVQQEVLRVRDHIFSGADGDDISDRVQDIRQKIEHLI